MATVAMVQMRRIRGHDAQPAAATAGASQVGVALQRRPFLGVADDKDGMTDYYLYRPDRIVVSFDVKASRGARRRTSLS